MRFAFKVFLAMFFLTSAILITLEVAIFRFVTSQAESEYLLRYENYSSTIGATLNQIDKLTDSVLLNAVYVLREKESIALPSNEALMRLKDELGVRSLSITDSAGNFLRSDWPIAVATDPKLKSHYKGKSAISQSLFTYCKDYKDLVTGRSSLEKTPIIPSGSGGFPGKFLMIPSNDRTHILEANMLMSAIGDILNNAMKPDANVVSIGLFTPTGKTLGYVPPDKGNPAQTAHPEMGPPHFLHPQRTKSGFVFFSKIPTTTEECCECKTKSLTAPDGSYYYVLRMEISEALLARQLAHIRRWFISIGFLGLILSAVVAHFISRHLVQKLAFISESVKRYAESDSLDLRLNVKGRDEVATLAQRFDSMMEQLQSSRRRLAAAEREKAFSEMARQVAHDVRSPLAALEIVGSDISNLPENHRAIFRSAISRVRDIANNLLEKHRESPTEDGSAADKPRSIDEYGRSVCMISGLVDPLLTEKRTQFRSKLGVEIDARLDAASYGLFAKIQPIEFKRVLSNLVNNAVEALGEKGAISVLLTSDADKILIKVQDNGKGIPPAILAKLGQRGETHGKADGSGLGLYHARTSVESWGGSLEMASEVGKGTTMTIMLPQAQPPGWFVSKLELAVGGTIVVLDDDASIHQIWQGRFDSLKVKEPGIEVFHFSTPEELRAWVRSNPAKAHAALYLTDYELLGHEETGLSMAEELNLGERAILVTSRYEEAGVLDGCRRLKVRMIPKGLASLVPIQIENPPPATGLAHERWDAVLIDDDPLTRMTWKMAASQAGKKFRSFSTMADFFKEAPALGRETPVYIDAELADGVDGAQESLQVRDLGFQEIHLATGHEAAKFAAYKHLRGVVGKEPPWS